MSMKSTNVRLIRLAARISAVIAPGLAARWAERLFLTPTRFARPERDERWLVGAERSWLSFDDGRRLPIFSWGTLLDYAYSVVAHRDYYGHV